MATLTALDPYGIVYFCNARVAIASWAERNFISAKLFCSIVWLIWHWIPQRGSGGIIFGKGRHICMCILYGLESNRYAWENTYCFYYEKCCTSYQLLCTCTCMIIAFRYNFRVIKLTSPNLNYVIILGAAMLMVGNVFVPSPSTDLSLIAVFCPVSPVT